MTRPWSRRAKFAGFWGAVLAVAIAFDQLGNALTGGDPDMTISTRCGLRLQSDVPSRTCRWLCAVLDLIDENHCADARE